MEMLRSFRGDKHELCLAFIKFKFNLIFLIFFNLLIN